MQRTSIVIPMEKAAFRRRKFELHTRSFTFDNWGALPPKGWRPADTDSPLGERLPIDWDADYRTRYRQLFQPAVFWRNAASLVNFAARNPDQATACAALFDQLFEVLMDHSVAEPGMRFVINNFDFPRYGTTIPSGWSGSIMNAFALTGLVKGLGRFRQPKYGLAAAAFANAFKRIHRHGAEPPERWISYLDADGYLWFDEYPLPDGSASRVLNGHIFSVFALALYLDQSGDESVQPLIEGGLTTIKDNVLRFRRPGQINIYDLRNGNRADYGPERTIKQQSQLFTLTGDDFFRGMAYIFYQDAKDSGVDVGDWTLSYCKQEV